MDSSVGSTIEKLKILEQEKESELKVKREFESTVYNLNKCIRETKALTEKFEQEIKELIKKNNLYKSKLEIEKIKCTAMKQQVQELNAKLNELQTTSDQGMKEIWNLRSSLSSTVQFVSDKCDLRALLMKPVASAEIIAKTTSMAQEETPKVLHEERLNEATRRKEDLKKERERLQVEPECGEEFVRQFICLIQPKRSYCAPLQDRENQPIKFTTSQAAQRTVRPIVNKQKATDEPWYQSYIIFLSTTVFMTYFFILREENDIDQEFSKTLYDRIEGLEKVQLLQSYQYNKEHGKSVVEIELRLKELEEKENAKIKNS